MDLLVFCGTPQNLLLFDIGPLLRRSTRPKRSSSVTPDCIDDLGPGDLAFLVGVGGYMTTKRVDLFLETGISVEETKDDAYVKNVLKEG